jgi:phosphoribosylamine-glycine ligase
MGARIMREIVEPVLRGMHAEGTEYRGFLYCGLMMTCAGPKVIEYNVRFGDPEAQAVLPLVDGSLATLLAAAADGDLARREARLRQAVSVAVVLAAGGYPGPLASPAAGTATREGRLVTAGGRVLTVVATAADYRVAIDRAYEAVSLISFDGMQYRRDIGRKALTPPHLL